MQIAIAEARLERSSSRQRLRQTQSSAQEAKQGTILAASNSEANAAPGWNQENTLTTSACTICWKGG